MPDYVIHNASTSDLEDVYAIFSLADTLHRQAYPEIFKEASDPVSIKEYLLASILADDATVFVAKVRGEIIGAILAWIRHSPDIPQVVKNTYISVENLVVSENYRQIGVGKALMEQVHHWSRERGIKQIQLTVWDFNDDAQIFYQNLGYKMLYHQMWKKLP